jgi:hypothetical protein
MGMFNILTGFLFTDLFTSSRIGLDRVLGPPREHHCLETLAAGWSSTGSDRSASTIYERTYLTVDFRPLLLDARFQISQ